MVRRKKSILIRAELFKLSLKELAFDIRLLVQDEDLRDIICVDLYFSG